MHHPLIFENDSVISINLVFIIKIRTDLALFSIYI